MAGHAYAHTAPGQPQDAWEPLEAHLRLVATGSGDFPGAAGFAAPFDAEACGRILGLWHDLGKYERRSGLPQVQRGACVVGGRVVQVGAE